MSKTWADADASQVRLLAGLSEAVASIGSSWTAWRGAQLAEVPNVAPAPRTSAHLGAPTVDPLSVAMALAVATSQDGRQRAADLLTEGLEALQELRLAVRDALCRADDQSELRRVRPWLWTSATSGGAPISASGRETGYELRLSRYADPVC